MVTRRAALHAAMAAAAAVAMPARATRDATTPIEVWKSPSCGCCADWIRLLEAQGFRAIVHDVGNAAARARFGIPAALGSCHTARVDGYTVEGHVPGADIRRLLRERPSAVGLAVPGMPVGSPGMDGPIYGGRRDPFDVLLVLRDGSTRVWARHR